MNPRNGARRDVSPQRATPAREVGGDIGGMAAKGKRRGRGAIFVFNRWRIQGGVSCPLGLTLKLPTERLYTVDGRPREAFVPAP